MANVLVEESSLSSIADAIRTKNGSTNTYKPSEMGGAILDIPEGSDLPELTNPALDEEVFEGKDFVNEEGVRKVGTFTLAAEGTAQDELLSQIEQALINKGAGGRVNTEESDINFYDYDGTCLYSYTLEEAQALTELPPLPSHDGLVCQGWNWTLDELHEWNNIADIGAVYITDDGDTRIYIEITSLLRMPMTLNFNQTVDSGVEVDFDNGEGVQTVTGTGAVSIDFSYSAIGKYCIKMRAKSGTYSFETSRIFNKSTVQKENQVYMNTIKGVEVGEGITAIKNNALMYARSMEYITIPQNVTSLRDGSFRETGITVLVAPPATNPWTYYGFYDCGALKAVCGGYNFASSGFGFNSAVRSCPKIRRVVFLGSTDISQTLSAYVCQGNEALEKVVFKKPELLTQISSGAFHECWSLQEFEIPVNVTTISAQAFCGCYGMKCLRFKPTTPPTVSNANAFTDLPTDCIIEVPTGTLEAYTTATNYPSADTYTYVEVDT